MSGAVSARRLWWSWSTSACAASASSGLTAPLRCSPPATCPTPQSSTPREPPPYRGYWWPEGWGSSRGSWPTPRPRCLRACNAGPRGRHS
eukprot:10037653-Alexandrium_andersonii.AAC.1